MVTPCHYMTKQGVQQGTHPPLSWGLATRVSIVRITLGPDVSACLCAQRVWGILNFNIAVFLLKRRRSKERCWNLQLKGKRFLMTIDLGIHPLFGTSS